MKKLIHHITALLITIAIILGMTGCSLQQLSESRKLERALEALEDEYFDEVLELVEEENLGDNNDLLRAVKKYLKNLASELEDGELEADEVEEILEDMEDLLDELDNEDLFELAEELLNDASGSAGVPDAPATQPAQPEEIQPQTMAYRIAMITDYGDISDRSFNQTTWEAVEQFGMNNNVDFKYYKPASNDTAGRVASVELAIAEGYNVIVMPGYAFGGTIAEVSGLYPNIKFIALDVSKSDLLEGGVALKGEAYDYNPDNWELTDYVHMDNVYCAIYREELAGYMAGYAAVKLGYTKLGFLGGMAVPAVMRYGYGYVQGADDAAAELGIQNQVTLNYAYANQFYGDATITAAMDTWYDNGTEVVFACGGHIYTSVAEAARKVDGKVIGVDVDQAASIDSAYGEGITVTSAMKGLAATTVCALTDIVINGRWADYAGKIETLGLTSLNPEENHVQLPMNSTQWNSSFTREDYKRLVADIYRGYILVSSDIQSQPVAGITVLWYGNIK